MPDLILKYMYHVHSGKCIKLLEKVDFGKVSNKKKYNTSNITDRQYCTLYNIQITLFDFFVSAVGVYSLYQI